VAPEDRVGRSGPGGDRRRAVVRSGGGPCCDEGDQLGRRTGTPCRTGAGSLAIALGSTRHRPLGARSYPRSTRARWRGTRYGEPASRRQPEPEGEP
jgi:hypothetical protein